MLSKASPSYFPASERRPLLIPPQARDAPFLFPRKRGKDQSEASKRLGNQGRAGLADPLSAKSSAVLV